MKKMLHQFLRWCPGALGLWLRGKLYPAHFGSCGRGVLFGRFVDFHGADRIYLGKKVVISNGVVLDAGESETDQSEIRLGDEVFIGAETTLSVAGKGRIEINKGSNLSSYCTIKTRNNFTMGTDRLVAGYCLFGENEADKAGKDISIGDGCWLGVRLLVNPGVSIGHDAIVGAHAVVECDIKPFAIAVGNPATAIKIRGNG